MTGKILMLLISMVFGLVVSEGPGAWMAWGEETQEQKAEDLAKVERKRNGTWKPVSGKLGGSSLPEATLNAVTLKIDGKRYEVTFVGVAATDQGTLEFDFETTPFRMLIKGTEGPNQGKTIPAIFEMKDSDKLRICYDLSGEEFPSKFQSPKGTQWYLVEYRRQVADEEGR